MKKKSFHRPRCKIAVKNNVLALENILVAQSREIGNGPFLYLKFSWIGVKTKIYCHLTLVPKTPPLRSR